MSLDITKQRLQSAKDRVDRHIDQNLLLWATEEILLPGQTDMVNSGLSERAARALSIEKTGYLKVELVWDLRDDKGKPIHFYLEEGTGPHTIRAKGKLEGGADALHWVGPSGKDVFRKVVQHPGSTKYKGLVQSIKDERTPDLQNRIIRETEHFLEVNQIQ